MMMMAKLNMWSHWGYAVLRRNWTKTRVICLSIPFCRRGATSSRGVPEFIDIDPACKKNDGWVSVHRIRGKRDGKK